MDIDYSTIYKVPRPYMGDLLKPLSKKKYTGIPKGLPVAVDTDFLVYKSAFASQESRYMVIENGDSVFETSSRRELKECLKQKPHLTEENDVEVVETVDSIDELENRINLSLEDIQLDCHTDMNKLTLYMGNDKPVFRDKICTYVKYKDGRSDRPVLYDESRGLYIAKGAKLCAGVEADDALAHLGRKWQGRIILASVDKDLRTIVGWYYSPMKAKDGVVWISEYEACFEFYKSLIIGDRADNIKCLSGTRATPGIGENNKLIAELAECETELAMLNFVGHLYDTHPCFDKQEWYTHANRREAMCQMANLLYLRINPDKDKWELL